MKLISPSKIIKFLFPDSYKEVPEWILEMAADFGKDLHESIQAYIEKPNLDEEIKELLVADKKIKLYESFKNWFHLEEIKEPKSEFFIEVENLHGYIDLIDDKYSFKFWDYKFRNVDKKLDILKDIMQMKVYELMLLKKYQREFSWELVLFDKKTAKIFTFNRSQLSLKQNKLMETIIKNAILILEQLEQLEEFKKEKLNDWKQ